MRGLPVVFICIALLFFVAVNNKQKNDKVEKTIKKMERQMNLSGLENFKYKVTPMSKNVEQFLQTRDPYKSYYLNGKKFVVYVEIPGCPYNGAFVSSIKKYKNSAEYSAKYNFLPLPRSGSMMFNTTEEYKGYKDFHNACAAYCIVNPDKKQIFGMFESKYDVLIAYMDRVFSQLQNW